MGLPTLQMLLRNRQALYRNTTHLSAGLLIGLVVISVIGMGLFGAVSGLNAKHWWQVTGPAWKVLVSYWGTMVICLPSLYIFSVIRGSRLGLKHLVVYAVGCLATIGIVLVSLAPITGFFTWTSAIPEQARVLYFAGGGLAFIFGVRFLGDGLLDLHKQAKEQSLPSSSAVDILFIWLMLFLIVMAQMIDKLKL